jgi:hypothetical protein
MVGADIGAGWQLALREAEDRSGQERVGQMTRRINLPVLGFVLLTMPLLDAATFLRVLGAISQGEKHRVVLTGRASCVEPSGRVVPDDDDCAVESVKFLFHSKDGNTYSFVPDDALTAMFSDHRVRQRDLQITAWERRKGQLELVAVESTKNGKLYDLYYYCQICNITAYAPGPCPCCRRDLEFRETPAPGPEP